MAKGSAHTLWHILNFHIDEESDAVLTVWAGGSKYHVIANHKQLGTDTEVAQDYQRLVTAIKGSADQVKGDHDPDRDNSSDSGVDVRSRRSKSDSSDEPQRPQSCEEALQQWMMSPLVEDLKRSSKPEKGPRKTRTLQEWYHGPLNLYQLQASDEGSTLEAVEADSSSDLDKWMEALLPKVTLPKYLTNKLTAPWYEGSELEVLECSDKPVGTPYHPCRVRHRESKETYFLKIVDTAQPQPAKRELDILYRVQQTKLHEQIRVPLLQGLVTFDDVAPTSTGQKRIMGMLLTEIQDATPLTMKFDTDVPQEKRERWAKEVDRIKDILHEHDIVWGDAKADNFMVDAEDNLWIIDFGGSYTEGWVDPELNETEEGDDMGTEKVVNALQDPVANVQRDEDAEEDGEEEDEGAKEQGLYESSQARTAASKDHPKSEHVDRNKRKRSHRSKGESEDTGPRKLARADNGG